MGYGMGRAHAPVFSIKTIWGIAKSKELNMSEDDLYSFVMRETGKSSIRALNQAEINKVCTALSKLKDSISGNSYEKRTDVGGNTATSNQRKKIYKLTEELGWNNNNARINGFVKKMFKVSRLEWLSQAQCDKLIEMLKKMVDRSKTEGCDSHE